MLHRKIYQLCCDGREVWIFLRDQQRWIERARILDVEGDLVTLRYETEEEDEACSWEEMVRLESIGAVTQKLQPCPKVTLTPWCRTIALRRSKSLSSSDRQSPIPTKGSETNWVAVTQHSKNPLSSISEIPESGFFVRILLREARSPTPPQPSTHKACR
jgi:hypothetical protein